MIEKEEEESVKVMGGCREKRKRIKCLYLFKRFQG